MGGDEEREGKRTRERRERQAKVYLPIKIRKIWRRKEGRVGEVKTGSRE